MITTRRFIATCAVGFVVSQVMAVIVFGFVLGSDYEPFRGTLLRTVDTMEWQMLMAYPLIHLAFVTGFVWMYTRIATPGGGFRQGLTIGAMAWLMTHVPQWLLWYAEQPWPGELIVKQLVLALVSVLVLSVVVTAMCRASIDTGCAGATSAPRAASIG